MTGSRPEMRPATLVCGILGLALVVLFGLPVVSAVLRGVMPYDLTGLTPGSLPERFEETAPLLCLALGVVAIGAAASPRGRVWTPLAVLFTGLLTWCCVELNEGSSLPVAILRLAIMGGGPAMVTVLVAACTRRPQRH